MTTIIEEPKKSEKQRARSASYKYDPMELCLIGGAKLTGDERSPEDTDDGQDHPLWDPRTTEPLDESFIGNVDAYGVLEGILVTRMDGKIVVVNGRHRVRAARVVNVRRKKRGEPPLMIDASMRKGDDSSELQAAVTLMGPMNAGNVVHIDGPLAKIQKLRRMIDRGVALEDAAITFAVSKKTIEQWLAYDEKATKEVKKAVEAGKITVSAATDIVRKLVEPEKQNAALDELLAATPSGQKPSRRQAKAAAKKAKKGSDANVGIPEKRVQRKLLQYLKSLAHPNAGVAALNFWSGAEAMLELVLGDETADARLVKALEESESWEPKKATKKEEK